MSKGKTVVSLTPMPINESQRGTISTIEVPHGCIGFMVIYESKTAAKAAQGNKVELREVEFPYIKENFLNN